MSSAAVKRYWDWIGFQSFMCVCGRDWEHLHHIIHVNGQRITKDDMLVIGLCQKCHQGKGGIHDLGGERQFLETTGWDLVQIATLRRHNFEVRR